jgi:hypothetical protein
MAKKKKGNKKPPKPRDILVPWELVLELEKRTEYGYFICPLCENEIPGSKRNLRGHLRSDDHYKDEAVSYLVSWSDYYDEKGTDPGVTEEEAEIQVAFITGTTIRLRLPGDSIVKKIRQHGGLEPTGGNFFELQKEMTAALVEYMDDLLKDKDWLPLAELEE